jgi:hypothetical protein
VLNPDGSVTATGHIATQACGDVLWTDQPGTVTVHVLAGAKITVDNAHGVPQPITMAKFPGYMKANFPKGETFEYYGPLSAVTSLADQPQE